MYKIDFNHPMHIHFIGIGGISMSGLAEILLKEGFTVSGSDTKESPLTKKLESEGAHIAYGQCAENITPGIGCVVYTAAINRSNPELIEAVAQKIPMLTRAELLGQLMKNYDTPIAVSGTHGKTTTTSMISHILLEADMDPTISVGGILKAIGGNIRVGSSGTFITEACEYTNSFLHFFPKISVILNIEEDHLDFFKDLEDIRHSFHQFAALLPDDGTLVINGDIKDYPEIYRGLSCNVVTYGSSSDFDYSADNITYDENGHVSFDLILHGEKTDHICLSVTGDHNVSNALSAIAVADLLDIPISPHNSVWCVFQPHTYPRTKAFFHEFAEALSHADHLVLADIYAARETDTLGISSADLAKETAKLGTDTHYYPSFEEIEAFLKENCRPGDLLITMGAGDVVTVGEDLLRQDA